MRGLLAEQAPAHRMRHLSGYAIEGGSRERRTVVRSRGGVISVVAAVGAVTLLLVLGYVSHLQADGYKALYDGRWIAQHGIPHREALTVAARGRSWVDEQWLAELIYYEAWRLGGYALLAILGALALAVSYMTLAALMLRRGASATASVCWSMFAIFTILGWAFTRSQNLALPLFAGLLALCLTDAERQHPTRRLLLLLPLLAAWANVHGSVVLGACLATLYLAQRGVTTLRRGSQKAALACAALAGCCALTPLATPYGLSIVHYYREFVGNGPMAIATAEWDPPAFPAPDFFLLYVPLVLLLVVALRSWINGRRPSGILFGGVVVTAISAGLEGGSIVWFGMTSALLFAEMTRTLAPRRPTRAGVLAMTASAVAAGAVVVALLATRTVTDYQGSISTRVLAAASSYAASHPCSRILADNWDASALLWLDPSLYGRIGFDARLEQYSRGALSRWLAFEVGPKRGWLKTTAGYQLLIGNAAYTPELVTRLATIPRGRVLARDGLGIATLVAPESGCVSSRD